MYVPHEEAAQVATRSTTCAAANKLRASDYPGLPRIRSLSNSLLWVDAFDLAVSNPRRHRVQIVPVRILADRVATLDI